MDLQRDSRFCGGAHGDCLVAAVTGRGVTGRRCGSFLVWLGPVWLAVALLGPVGLVRRVVLGRRVAPVLAPLRQALG